MPKKLKPGERHTHTFEFCYGFMRGVDRSGKHVAGFGGHLYCDCGLVLPPPDIEWPTEVRKEFQHGDNPG